jgi:hypothetical protein
MTHKFKGGFNMNIKTCCGCPDGKEIIYCGCECHKQGYVAVYDKEKGAWAVPAIGEYYESKEEAEFQANNQEE